MGNIRDTHRVPGVYHSMKNVARRVKRHDLHAVKTLGGYNRKHSGGGDKPITTVWVFGDLFPAVFS